MCGIVGFIGSEKDTLYIKGMNAAQIHRGPDDSGYYYCPINKVHLGMSRLSILDIKSGIQPMANNNNDIWIIYNGEIFNSPELRVQLEKLGHRFKTSNSDTEVIIKMYEEYGINMLDKLNGMFALTIYDIKKNKLFSARDQFGIKPFFYSTTNGKYSFSSEIKSLLRLPWISKALNKNSIFHYFSFQFIPDTHSVYKDIKKLLPGHFIEWDLNTKLISINNFINLELDKKTNIKDIDLNDYILDGLKEAVNRWSLSDVPVACSLSGGIDSSAILAIMAEQSEKKIKTFTLGFQDSSEIDERHLAKKISNIYGTEHTEIEIKSENLLLEIDKMLYALDEPYAGGLPSWFVYKEMSKSVKVGLTGTGADELFGNYGKWYPYTHKKDFFKAIARYAFKKSGSIKDLVQNFKGCIYHPLYLSDYAKRNTIFNQEFVSEVDTNSEKLINDNFINYDNPIDAISHIDMKYQLPEEFLFMTDRFSMAHSIEIRTPFLDKKFSENMMRLPHSQKFLYHQLKKSLKESMSNMLPKEILESKKKGFVLPIEKWLKGPLKNDIIKFSENSYLINQNIFNTSIRKNFINPFLDNKTSNSEQVWIWWMFQRWWNINSMGTSI
jgi:asparagine synthase (glutamine-hydrolysing)